MTKIQTNKLCRYVKSKRQVLIVEMLLFSCWLDDQCVISTNFDVKYVAHCKLYISKSRIQVAKLQIF